jgi:hypothetical protein
MEGHKGILQLGCARPVDCPIVVRGVVFGGVCQSVSGNNLSASRPLISPTCEDRGPGDAPSIGTFNSAIGAATNHNAVLVQRAGNES